MTDDIEKMDGQRVRLIRNYAISFALWGFPLVAMMLVIGDVITVPRGVMLGLIIVQLLAFVAWTFFLIRLLAFGRRLRRSGAYGALDDERAKANTRASFAAAFWVVLAAAGLSIPVEVFGGFGLSAPELAGFLIVIGVLTSLFSFIGLEQRDAA